MVWSCGRIWSGFPCCQNGKTCPAACWLVCLCRCCPDDLTGSPPSPTAQSVFSSRLTVLIGFSYGVTVLAGFSSGMIVLIRFSSGLMILAGISAGMNALIGFSSAALIVSTDPSLALTVSTGPSFALTVSTGTSFALTVSTDPSLALTVSTGPSFAPTALAGFSPSRLPVALVGLVSWQRSSVAQSGKRCCCLSASVTSYPHVQPELSFPFHT